jgi:glucan phosphoethanolaminetransferase (alkaline phosphatase superfamily)
MGVNRAEILPIEHKPPQNNIVFVIDESLRGDHLSINGYSRDTTPTLKNLMDDGFIDNWGLAVSSTTCSFSSNPHILTGALPTIDDYSMVSTLPTIFQYAYAMGYRTYYLDAQENYLWNGLTPSDKKYIEMWKNSDDFGENYLADQQAARFIRQELQNSVGNFMVLNKKGMHIKYENNYPENEGLWFPTPPDKNYRINHALVLNTYDNAVHYNLESFFKVLLPNRKPLPNTVILYTSDHGDTLQENGEAWSHCSNTSPEATVPLFMIGEIENQPDTNYQASHSNIFPTLLDLMNVPENARQKQYNYSLLKANSSMNGPRYYFGEDPNPILYTPIH